MKVRVKEGREGILFQRGEILEADDSAPEGLVSIGGCVYSVDRFEAVDPIEQPSKPHLAAKAISHDVICVRCGKTFGAHSLQYDQCPTQWPWAGPEDPRPPEEHTFKAKGEGVLVPPAPAAPVEDPSARRDAMHVPQPVAEPKPYDHFPDLKGWQIDVGGEADGISWGCTEIL